jgi:diacylglycerol kinase (ATP)
MAVHWACLGEFWNSRPASNSQWRCDLGIDSAFMRICIIFNPAARGEKARRFKQYLDQIGPACVLKPTTAPGAGRFLAAEAVKEGYDTIVAAGGDGTLNEVVNGIVDAPDGLSRARLGVLPLGTVNVFAREIRLPIDLKRSWALLHKSREIQIDVPQAEFVNERGAKERRCFLQLAGAGWDARALDLVDWEWKKKIGVGAYFMAGLQALNHPQTDITISNGSKSATGEFVMIGNGRLYGGSFPIMHQADYQDRILDAVVFDKVNWSKLPAYLYHFLSGGLFKEGVTEYLQGKEFTLTSKDPALLQLEGDLVGRLPARISLLPQQLRVLAPTG